MRNARALWPCLLLLAASCTYGESVEPPESITAFNPTRVLPEVQRYAGANAELVKFEAYFVRSDGTMDFTAEYRPRLTYTFVRKRTTKDTAPIGTGQKGRAYEIIEVEVREPTWIHTSTSSGGVKKETTEHHKGMNRTARDGSESDWKERTSLPACGVEKVWKAARKDAGASKDAVATITWDHEGYEFQIDDLDIRARYDGDCHALDDSGKPIKTPSRRARRRTSDEEKAKRDAERRARERAGGTP